MSINVVVVVGCRVEGGGGSTMTAPVVTEWSFPFICPHWLWSSMRSVQTRPHTVHVRLIVASADGCCDWIAFLLFLFSSAVVMRSFSNTLDPSCTKLLYCILSWAVDFHLSVSMLQPDRECFRVSLKHFLCPPMDREPFFNSPSSRSFGRCPSSIRRMWPVRLSWALMRYASMLVVCALFRTSVVGIMSCHLIHRMMCRSHVWKDSSCLMCLL